MAPSSSPAKDIVLYVIGEQSRLKKGLRLAVDHVIHKHRITFKVTVKRLPGTGRSLDATFLSTANEMFRDNACSWGRIITLYIFGACLAKIYEEEGLPVDLMRFAQTMDLFVTIKWGSWIEQNGSFENMEAQFPEPTEDRVWRGLWITAAVGLTTLVILSICRSKK